MRVLARVVSWGTAVVGVSFLVALLPGGAEALTAGIGLTLGLLGLPTTLLGYILLDLTTSEGTTGRARVDALVIASCYFVQWQAIAFVIRRKAIRDSRLCAPPAI